MSQINTDHISVNTQSSIRIECPGGTVIYADPLEIKGSPHDADLILITHAHYDHFSPEDAAKIRKSTTKFVIPKGMIDDLEKIGVSMMDYACMEAGDQIGIAGVYVSAVPAYNKLKPFHPRRNGWLGYVLDIGGQKIYVAGDTDALKENTSIDCDIAMVPIGGKFTMNAKEAADFINAMSPAAVIPTHYGSIVGKPADYETFHSRVKDGIQVVKKLHF